jgi:hypothetical protein
MEHPNNDLNGSELRAELQALQQKLNNLEAMQANLKPRPVVSASGFARGMVVGLLLLVSSAVLIGSLLNAQSNGRAFFIDEQGNVAIATNLNAGGKIKATTFEGDGSALNLEGNKSVTDKLDKTGGTISGKLTIAGKSNNAGPALNVSGDITGDNVWTRIHDVQLSSAEDYTVQGLDGDAYRWFRIELQGTLKAEDRYGRRAWQQVIGIRPNGANSREDYGTGIDLENQHWMMNINEMTNFLPLCVAFRQLDGQVSCTGEMNTHTGMFRIMRSESSFIVTPNERDHHSGFPHQHPWELNRTIMRTTSAENFWRDQTKNVNSLTLYFGGAGGFTGRFVLYGKK